MKCSKCQFENPEGMKFCGKCGSKLEKICPHCHFSNPPHFKFCGECGQGLEVSAEPTRRGRSFEVKSDKIQRYLPEGLTEKILSQRDRIEGERRQVTVMFCDMKGFTPLTEMLGPEETFSLMNQVFEILIHKVNDYEGIVNELRGDGILALFGAPIALEDAPQRAIRSALAIHREMIRFNEKLKGDREIPSVLLRIGINTGPVVVGAVGNDLRVQLTVVGDTINMAARMEEIAEPGTTYVTEDSFKLTKGFFSYEALGEKKVKGKKTAVKVYRVLAPGNRRTRFEVSAERGLSPFVGRERELELLLDGFRRIKEGSGQAFSIVSEAGMGKSRLLYEFRRAVANENVTFLEGKCLSYSKGTAYHPFIDIIKSNFDIGEADGDTLTIDRVRSGLKTIGVDATSSLPYLLELLSVKNSGLGQMGMTPEFLKYRISDALKRVVLKSSEILPLVVAIEDLHWADKSSEAVSKYLLDNITGARVFLIFTYRPEFIHTWGGRSYHSQINLNRLSNRESLTLVSHLLRDGEIDQQLEKLILEKTEGVPFFIEEFVKSLRDMKVIEIKDGKYCLKRDERDLKIPATIQDVIMARIDSLPKKAKGVLQIGSVIGRKFDYNMMTAITDLPEKELLTHLSVLKDSELVYERGVYPQSTYVFKHALIQDTCYQSLLKSSCQKYHRKIAQLIEKLFPQTAKGAPEVLAHHLTEAGLVEKAIPYLQKAGEIAIRRSANLEAIDYLNKALEMVKTGPDKPARTRQELDLHIALGPAFMAAKGYTAPEVKRAYVRAQELCQQLGETRQLFTVLRGLWGFCVVRDELQVAHELGSQCLALAQRAESPARFLWAYYMFGMTSLHLGYLVSARERFEQGIALYDIHKRRSQRALQDPGVACLSYKAIALWLLGFPDQSLETSRMALSLAHKLAHPFSLAYSLNIAAVVCQLCNKVREAQKQAEAAIALAMEQRIPYWSAHGRMLQGWALIKQGQRKEGITQMRQGLSAYRATGAELGRPYFLSLLAENYGKGGEAEDGLALVAEALTLVDKNSERWYEAELRRLQGELLLSVSSKNYLEAEACFHQALHIARQQSAKSLELHAAMSLGRLWQKRGKKGEARRILAEVHGWFTEGFDTPDLTEAKLLLDQLA